MDILDDYFLNTLLLSLLIWYVIWTTNKSFILKDPQNQQVVVDVKRNQLQSTFLSLCSKLNTLPWCLLSIILTLQLSCLLSEWTSLSTKRLWKSENKNSLKMYRQNGILHTSKAKITKQHVFSKQYAPQLTLRIGILNINPVMVECGRGRWLHSLKCCISCNRVISYISHIE